MALVGLLFEERVAGDKQPWLKQQREIEEIAHAHAFRLDVQR
jgi:hypothetical protein